MTRRKQRLDFDDIHLRATALEQTLRTTTPGEGAVLAIVKALLDLKHAVEVQTLTEIEARLKAAPRP